MAGNYAVQQGDHLAKIAKTFGFSDWQTIWKHPNNADLKNKRQNPNVLYPGDLIFIPDNQSREESCSTDKKHIFVKKASDLKLRLTLRDQYEKPIANASCILILGGKSVTVKTDGKGKIEADIQPDDHEGILIIQDPETPFDSTPISFKIGDLDPVDETSGQVARLNNLGYFAGDLEQPDPAAFQSAVEEFQCDNSLTVDGICGPMTQAKLKKEHGC
jgi:N-acetylmuramoyl-L-alanine amidase